MKKTVFEPTVWPLEENPGARGWIKPGDDETSYKTLTLRYGSNPAAAEEDLMAFQISGCIDVETPIPESEEYEDVPGGAFVYDARYLSEPGSAEVADHIARDNLKAILEAYAWWKANRISNRVVFFCAAGINRSVTSAIVFAFSLLAEAPLPDEPSNSFDRPSWSIKIVEYDEEYNEYGYDSSFDAAHDTLLNFALRAVHEIRPIAFNRGDFDPVHMQITRDIASVVEDEFSAPAIARVVDERILPRLNWSDFWQGHHDNKVVLRFLDSILVSRLYGGYFEGDEWIGWDLPPILRPAEEARPGAPKKSRRGARAKIESGVVRL